MDPVTLYTPDGREYTVTTQIELVNLQSQGYSTEPPAAAFDPLQATVPEVEAHLAENPGDEARVKAIELEQEKPRKGVVDLQVHTPEPVAPATPEGVQEPAV